MAMFQIAVVISLSLCGTTPIYLHFVWGVLIGIFSYNGLLFWERNGWLHLMDAKDAEIQQLRESHDKLRKQIDSMAIDQSTHGPDTRIRT